MKVFAQTLNLKDDPEVIEKYKVYHSDVWPEVTSALKEVGILEMKIFLLGRRLFMYMTTTNEFVPEIDLPKYLTLDPRCQEWEDLMGEFQEPVKDAKPGEKWAMMEQVFDL
ncbi:MAG: L-rhamnose mutarotase [Bacteroidota bacterium]